MEIKKKFRNKMDWYSKIGLWKSIIFTYTLFYTLNINNRNTKFLLNPDLSVEITALDWNLIYCLEMILKWISSVQNKYKKIRKVYIIYYNLL